MYTLLPVQGLKLRGGPCLLLRLHVNTFPTLFHKTLTNCILSRNNLLEDSPLFALVKGMLRTHSKFHFLNFWCINYRNQISYQRAPCFRKRAFVFKESLWNMSLRSFVQFCPLRQSPRRLSKWLALFAVRKQLINGTITWKSVLGHNLWFTITGWCGWQSLNFNKVLTSDKVATSYITSDFVANLHTYRLSQKMTDKKIQTKIECCGAKFSLEHDLEALDLA